MRNLLVCIGGGLNGLPQAGFLNALEERAGKPLADIFDGGAGTSVGSIMVGGTLGCGLPAAAMREFFPQDGPVIFKQHALFDTVQDDLEILNRGWRYSGEVLGERLRARLGDTLMATAKKPILIPAFDHVTGGPFFFKSYDKQTALFLVREAAQASSSAQTYFPPYALPGHLFWDGGILGNNPASCLMADARRLWPGEEIRMLCVGCGTPRLPYAADVMRTAGGIKILQQTIAAALASTILVPAYEMRRELGENFYYVQPELPPLEMDDASAEALAAREAAETKMINDHQDVLELFAGR